MHQSKFQLDSFADAFKEDFGIDVASHTGLNWMLLIADFANQVIAVEGVLIQPFNSENPSCTQANQGCGEQHPAHQLKPLREWRSHGLSVEWVVPKGWFIKFFQQRVGF